MEEVELVRGRQASQQAGRQQAGGEQAGGVRKEFYLSLICMQVRER